ncbi:unnamed protein product [Caenorhabditis angaria]|uniref:C-type lectin domain-containing protein n=1 Tax=Caenorhabditis angaria TaxID=860376 RepID=A0A9P1I8I3_9PELO|nr:unnamed protein product [Caenorhabditis angaria]
MIVKLLVLFLCLLHLVDSCRLRCRNRTQCDDGWTYYKRNTTGWCMQVVSEPTTKTDGAAACGELGAVISSIDDSEMRIVIESLRVASNITTTTWIGATLKTECTSDECEKTDDNHCKQTETCGYDRFIWTDGYTTTQSDEYLADRIKNTTILWGGQKYISWQDLCFSSGQFGLPPRRKFSPGASGNAQEGHPCHRPPTLRFVILNEKFSDDGHQPLSKEDSFDQGRNCRSKGQLDS